MVNTPGSILKEARESKKLNIAQAVKGTRIRAIYLHAMEADDYQMLPSPVQLKGFLRIYAEFLELNSNDLLSLLPSQYQPDVQDIPPKSESELSKPNTSVDENSHSADAFRYVAVIEKQLTNETYDMKPISYDNRGIV